MDSDYPPLPRSRAARFSSPVLSQNGASPERGESPGDDSNERDSSDGLPAAKVISRRGDVVVVYADRGDSPEATHRWQVASKDLMQNSPYFRALLDPNKFSEGRDVMEQKMSRLQMSGQDTSVSDENAESLLPSISLPVEHFTRRLGIGAIELFLRILSFNSLSATEKADFEGEIRLLPTSLIARLVELSDFFNSPHAVRDMLKRSGYAFGKGRVVLSRFDASLLRMKEDRIRQIIFIADFLDERSVFQVLTHVLIIVGSKFWINGVEPPGPDTLRWHYFSGGLEEELYYRRQCVLNTIADLQAYFFRAYGALEEPEDPKQVLSNPASAPATTLRSRQFQCRMAFGNSSACDAFHLGQMTRFFTLRTKTVFLGSSLIDPDFDPEDKPDPTNDDDALERPHSGPPTDITAIIASLKTIPDYQIEPNHTGCGVRRRIVPALDCIEKFVFDSRGLLGVSLRHCPSPSLAPSLASISWSNRTLARAKAVDIRSARISAIYYNSGRSSQSASSQEDEARLFFTAKTRNWES